MLMPIVAALGSFVVSERILKPKATALFVLACLVVYDVFVSPPKPILQQHEQNGVSNNATSTTKNDNSELDEFWDYDSHHYYSIEEDDLTTSMRCYRGPALLAFALFCAAYSLRLWRRNGVACDELIFLPGTPHEFRCTGGEQHIAHGKADSEIEIEGGNDNSTNSTGEVSHAAEEMAPIQICFSEGDAAAGAAKSSIQHTRGGNRSHGSVEMEDLDVSSGAETPDVEQRPLIRETDSAPNSPMSFIRDQALKGIDMLVIRTPLRPAPLPTENDLAPGESSSAPTSTNNEVYDAEYAPSAPCVLGAALDLSLPVLFNFHMFVVLMKDHYKKEAESEEDHGPSDDVGDGKVDIKDLTWMKPPQVPPKILPLFFITPLIIRSMVPPRQRRRFCKTILQGTIFSPFKPVRFRDAFVADCATSLVRPIVDLVYALAYYGTAIFGLLSGKYDLNMAGYILSKSMIWHGLILPSLSVLPLFIRFLQTLRQAYDTGKRWPYLGNAFKYFTAGLVILYGMTHAAGERSFWWFLLFIFATIYQIIWDSFIDWELLVFVPRERKRKRTSSPNTIANLCRMGRDALPRLDQIRLRSKRLFDDDSFYWKALFANAALRFCWMSGFIPAYWVSISTGSTQVTFVDKAHGWSFVLLATLEIFRLSIWGIIKVELETIKMKGGGENYLTMASSADEYLREGKWKVPRDALDPKVSLTCRSVLTNKWRSRSNKTDRPTLEEDAQVVWLDSNQNQHQKLEQTEQSESDMPFEISKNPSEKQTYRWLCMSVSSSFLRWLYIVELLLWIVICLVASYYIILVE